MVIVSMNRSFAEERGCVNFPAISQEDSKPSDLWWIWDSSETNKQVNLQEREDSDTRVPA